jgi:hypothetical protein
MLLFQRIPFPITRLQPSKFQTTTTNPTNPKLFIGVNPIAPSTSGTLCPIVAFKHCSKFSSILVGSGVGGAEVSLEKTEVSLYPSNVSTTEDARKNWIACSGWGEVGEEALYANALVDEDPESHEEQFVSTL